jgi:hypothetical protein
MARWFRSEPMDYVSLIVNEDAAHDCLSELGALGVIQFTDVSRRSDLIFELSVDPATYTAVPSVFSA